MNAPARFRLQLMGGFRLSRDGTVVTPSEGCRRMLAVLAVRGMTSRRSLATTLWPECPDARAFGNLRTALWRTARHYPGLVVVRGCNVALDETVEVDLHELHARSSRLLKDISSDCSDPGDSGHNGNGLGGDPFAQRQPGELLPDWYDDWVVIERERLRQLRLHALEASARRLTAAGRYGAAARMALEAVQLDPLRDSAQELLIESFLAEGNVGAAARQLQSFCELLRVELGIQPAPRLTRLVAERLAERSSH